MKTSAKSEVQFWYLFLIIKQKASGDWESNAFATGFDQYLSKHERAKKMPNKTKPKHWKEGGRVLISGYFWSAVQWQEFPCPDLDWYGL